MQKPYGVIVAPQPVSGGVAVESLMSELSQQEADMAMIHEIQRSRRDLIGEQFDGHYYRTHYRFIGVTWDRQPLEVERWYPDREVAVDIFDDFTNHKAEIDFKRAFFKERGMRYVALSLATSELTDVLAQIGKL